MKKKSESEKKEEEKAHEFRELMQKRGIADEKAYMRWLREQKTTKRGKSETRLEDVVFEIDVLDKILRGEL